MGKSIKYIDEDGYIFVDGSCVAAGKFRRYSDRSEDWWWDNI